VSDLLGSDLAPLLRVGLAALLGALVGLERELARKPAGLRTHMLVAASAALFLTLGEILMDRYSAAMAASVRADPVRIMHAVILGVSFLGAGTILTNRGSGRVEGLTTAAGVLVTTGIGMAAALGRARLATVLAFGVVIVLGALGALERKLSGRSRPSGER
jgi:putative Mg2+ transporter-C (MgtC) family protein